MSVRVTVSTHAWRARVTIKSSTQGGEGHNVSETVELVEPSSERTFFAEGPNAVTVQEVQPSDDDAHPSAKSTATEIVEKPEPDVKPLPLRGSAATSASKEEPAKVD